MSNQPDQNPSSPQPQASQAERDSELLTAYLDGELADADAIEVERRLADDPEFHAQMRELQSAWDMLDSLPLVRPNSAFVQTTLELAIAPKTTKGKWIGPTILGLLILLPVSMFAAGFWLTRESIEQPERELVYDLPLIENYDRYKNVISENDAKQSVQFLKSIYRNGLFAEVEGLFPTEVSDDVLVDFETATQPPSPDKIRDRSERVSKLTEEQFEELFLKKQKFESLSKKEQTAIREFHELLSQSPQRTELVETLVSYYDWLKTLGSNQRASLLDMPWENRLHEIRNITRTQAEKAFGMVGSTKLPLDDAVWFYQWYDHAIRTHSQTIRDRTGKIWAQWRINEGKPEPRPSDIDRIRSGPIEQLVEFLMLRDRDFFGQLISRPSPKHVGTGINYLRRIISPEARNILDELDSDAERQELVLKWIEAANKTRFPIKTASLKSFYEQLPQEERDLLDNLDPEDWHDSLTRMYWDANIGKRSEPSEDEAFEKFLRESGFDYEFGIDNES
jgi:hypothetical protein